MSLLKLFIHVGQDFSNEMVSLREHAFIKTKVYSRDHLVWWKTKAKEASFWHPTSWAAGPLGRPAQSWQELKSSARTDCQCPAWKSSTLLASKGRRPCSTSVRSLRNFLYSHSLVILTFHSNSERDCERLTLLWIAVLFIICFTVSASCAEICKSPSMVFSSKSS